MDYPSPTKQIVVRKMPVDLWQRLKIQAVAENITLQDAVAKAIKQYVTAA